MIQWQKYYYNIFLGDTGVSINFVFKNIYWLFFGYMVVIDCFGFVNVLNIYFRQLIFVYF